MAALSAGTTDADGDRDSITNDTATNLDDSGYGYTNPDASAPYLDGDHDPITDDIATNSHALSHFNGDCNTLAYRIAHRADANGHGHTLPNLDTSYYPDGYCNALIHPCSKGLDTGLLSGGAPGATGAYKSRRSAPRMRRPPAMASTVMT
ncbi:MAG: hypothetical protein ACE5OS_15575 [Anaerolineae bacterium]